MRIVRTWLLGFCLVLSAHSEQTAKASTDVPNTSVIVLVDVSASFAPFSPEDIAAMRGIAQAIEGMAIKDPRWKVPIYLHWRKVGSPKSNTTHLCGDPQEYRPTLPGMRKRRNSHENELRSRQELSTWLKVCVDRIAENKSRLDAYTDLSGAIAIATQVSRAVPGIKVLVIFSDFMEDLPPDTQPSSFTLNGEVVVLVSRPSSKATDSLRKLETRLTTWTQRFAQNGASKVCQRSVTGLQPGIITSCFLQE